MQAQLKQQQIQQKANLNRNVTNTLTKQQIPLKGRTPTVSVLSLTLDFLVKSYINVFWAIVRNLRSTDSR